MFEKISKNIQKMQLCFFSFDSLSIAFASITLKRLSSFDFFPLFISVCASVCVCQCALFPLLSLLTPTIPFPNYNNDYKIYLYLCVSFSCFLPIFLMIICFFCFFCCSYVPNLPYFCCYFPPPPKRNLLGNKKPLARPSQHTQSSVHPSQPQKH